METIVTRTPATPHQGSPRGRLPLLAGSYEGLATLPVHLAQAIDAALSVTRGAGPVPCGPSERVLSSAMALLGRRELPSA